LNDRSVLVLFVTKDNESFDLKNINCIADQKNGLDLDFHVVSAVSIENLPLFAKNDIIEVPPWVDKKRGFANIYSVWKILKTLDLSPYDYILKYDGDTFIWNGSLAEMWLEAKSKKVSGSGSVLMIERGFFQRFLKAWPYTYGDDGHVLLAGMAVSGKYIKRLSFQTEITPGGNEVFWGYEDYRCGIPFIQKLMGVPASVINFKKSGTMPFSVYYLEIAGWLKGFILRAPKYWYAANVRKIMLRKYLRMVA